MKRAHFLNRLAAAAGRALSPSPHPQGYAICATPRSGSNYLCELLASTGRLGVPREYFNAPGRRHYDDPDFPDDPHEQLARIRTTGATPNGIYGVKLHAFQMKRIADIVDPFAALPGIRAIRLRRNDRLAQAISWSRVRQTRQYRAGDAPESEPRYDAAEIRRSLQSIENQEKYWRKRLRKIRQTPLEIAYEDLIQDPQREVDRVAAHLGLRETARIDPSLVSVAVQRDELSEEWRRRFLAEPPSSPLSPGSASAS